MWHRLLIFLRIRNGFDWAPPAFPEVKHPYYGHETLHCCDHCGGGYRHAIHQTPWDERRKAEVERIELQKAKDRCTVHGFPAPELARFERRCEVVPNPGYIEREH